MNKKTRLKPDEVRYLTTLSPQDLSSRLLALYDSGWSLNILAQSLNPPKAKSTVHFWVSNATPKEQERPIPPIPLTPLPSVPGTSVRSVSPSVPKDIGIQLATLAPLASKYRANTPPDSLIAMANRELTEISLTLSRRGVPVIDIAYAAGVSYRSIARRVASA